MKIVIAPQAFKGGLRAMEAARAMQEGVRLVLPSAETVLLPVADGGDGTMEALVEEPGKSAFTAVLTLPRQVGDEGFPSPCMGKGQDGGEPSQRQLAHGSYFHATVTGPLGVPVQASWGVMAGDTTAVIEMARASGLALVPTERRDPLTATTHGTGQLIRAALDAGYREIIVGLGGSATNDGAAGMAQALGARLSDAQGQDVSWGGAALARLHHIDLRNLDARLKGCRLLAATDVRNPLCGPEGASAVYGPQKGATPAMVRELDAALLHFAQVIMQDVGVDVLAIPRAGAAGGAGAGMVALLGAEISSGGELVCDALWLDRHLEGASLVLTGEGRLDGQTIYDKAPIVVAHRAAASGIPVLAVAGSLGPGYEAVLEHGIKAVEAATPQSMPLHEAMRTAYELVRDAAARAVRQWSGLHS